MGGGKGWEGGGMELTVSRLMGYEDGEPQGGWRRSAGGWMEIGGVQTAKAVVPV